MNLTNAINGVRAAIAPAAPRMDHGRVLPPVQDLIIALKAADEKQRKLLMRSRIFFVIATGIFCVSFLALWLSSAGSAADGSGGMLRLGGLALIYVYVTILFIISVRRLARIDYAAPVLQFLRKAEIRYRFMPPSDWIVVITGLPFAAGVMSLGSVPYLSRVFGFADAFWPMIAFFVMFVLGVAALGLYFTRREWERERASLWRHITAALREFESE